MKKIIGLFLIYIHLWNVSPVSSEELKVAIASQNPQKISAVSMAFKDSLGDDAIEFISYKSSSGIPEQPVGEKVALKGALNRIHSIPQDILYACDYAVSIESYIEFSPETLSWNDIGLIVIKDLKLPMESVLLTKTTPIPEYLVLLAQQLSSEITDEGYSVTVGHAIKESFTDRIIDDHDWHREDEFGGVSRVDLLYEAIVNYLN